MKLTEIRYDMLVEQALRSVIEDALSQVEKTGFPGEHHFYITFQTTHPDVALPDYLQKQYPEDMTLILQPGEYDNLHIEDKIIAVTLSFNDRHEHIKFPLESITVFADPTVNFALQFQTPSAAASKDPFALDGKTNDHNIEALNSGKKKKTPLLKTNQSTDKVLEASKSAIVSLDAFRKKAKKAPSK